MTRALPLAASLLTLVACQAAGSGAAEPELGPPPPFTAEEIRLGNPPGTTRTFETTRAGAIEVQTVRFLASDDPERARMEVVTIPAGASEPGPPVTATAAWTELRDHAAFPPDKASRVPATCQTRAGEFAGWLYEVADEIDGVSVTTRYWFAEDEPGPPVLFESLVAGKRAMRSELVERRGGG